MNVNGRDLQEMLTKDIFWNSAESYSTTKKYVQSHDRTTMFHNHALRFGDIDAKQCTSILRH